MSNWLMTDQIDKDTYIISKYRNRVKIHVYPFNGTDHSLLIDTGPGTETDVILPNFLKQTGGLRNSFMDWPRVVSDPYMQYNRISINRD